MLIAPHLPECAKHDTDDIWNCAHQRAGGSIAPRSDPSLPLNMSTPSKAQKRKHGKNGWPPWLTKKRRPQASPTKNYTHPFSRELGRTIKAWRMAHGLTATAVADLAKLARSALAKIERGEAWFSSNMVARVCDAMGACLAAITYEALRRCGRFPRQKCRL